MASLLHLFLAACLSVKQQYAVTDGIATQVFGTTLKLVSPESIPPVTKMSRKEIPLQLDKLGMRSVAHSSQQKKSVLNFFPGHQIHTDSSVIGGIITRYAGRHRVKLLEGQPVSLKQLRTAMFNQKDQLALVSCTGSTGINILEFTAEEDFKYRADKQYPAILLEIRDPVQNLLSWYNYKTYGDTAGNQDALKLLAEATSMPVKFHNLQAKRLGLGSREEVATFILNQLSPDLGVIPVLTERIDECLVLLRRMFNWEFIDITNIKHIYTHGHSDMHLTDGGKKLYTLHGKQVPQKLQSDLKSFLELDEMIYSAAAARFEKLVKVFFKSTAEFDQDMSAYKTLNAYVAEHCDEEQYHSKACKWYLDAKTGTPNAKIEGVPPSFQFSD